MSLIAAPRLLHDCGPEVGGCNDVVWSCRESESPRFARASSYFCETGQTRRGQEYFEDSAGGRSMESFYQIEGYGREIRDQENWSDSKTCAGFPRSLQLSRKRTFPTKTEGALITKRGMSRLPHYESISDGLSDIAFSMNARRASNPSSTPLMVL